MAAETGLPAASIDRSRARRRMFCGRLKVLAALAAIAAATGAAAAPTASAQKAPVVKSTQKLALLVQPHKVFPTPRRRSPAGTVGVRRPITGTQTALPVLRRTMRGGTRWLRVMVPGRPNGRKGWIARRATVPATTSWHVVVRTSSRLVRVYLRGSLVQTFAAIVGKPSTPTPHGRFFVEESVLMPPGSAGGPYAFALSARSNVLQEFGGGPGQIAMHGVENLGGSPGTAISHGCIRLANHQIRWLAARLEPGAPVTVKP